MGKSPYVRYALAKAVKKGEDTVVSLPTQQWPTGAWRATPGPRTYGLYAVIDGHNGAAAAEFTCAALPDRFAAELRAALATHDGAREDALRTALSATFLALDAEFGALGVLSGATCTVVVQMGWLVSVANIGDSRAILDAGGAEILQLTYDFRLEDSPEERKRILANGAILRRLAESGRGPCDANEVGYGPLRVWPGGLALSRAIGDRDVGDCIVAHPYVKQLRVPETAAVRLIIASDGVWDACGNAAVAKPVRRADVEAASHEIVAHALRVRGLRDDTTVICLDLCPDASPLAVHWEARYAARRKEESVEAAEARARRGSSGSSGGGGGGGGGGLLCCFGGGGGQSERGDARSSWSGASGRGQPLVPVVRELCALDTHPSCPVLPPVGPTPPRRSSVGSLAAACGVDGDSSVNGSDGSFDAPPVVGGAEADDVAVTPSPGDGSDDLLSGLQYEGTEHAGRNLFGGAAAGATAGAAATGGSSTPGATEHAGGGFAAQMLARAQGGGGSGGDGGSEEGANGSGQPRLQRQLSSGAKAPATSAPAPAPAAATSARSGSMKDADQLLTSSSAAGGRAGTHHWGESDVAAVFAAVAEAEAGPGGGGRAAADEAEDSVKSRGSRRRGGAGAAAAVAAAEAA